MWDKKDRAHLIHYGSNKSRRVIRSDLGAEAFGLADAWEQAIVIQYDLKQMLKNTLNI